MCDWRNDFLWWLDAPSYRTLAIVQSGDGLYSFFDLVPGQNNRADFFDYVVQMDISEAEDRSAAEPGMEIPVAHQYV